MEELDSLWLWARERAAKQVGVLCLSEEIADASVFDFECAWTRGEFIKCKRAWMTMVVDRRIADFIRTRRTRFLVLDAEGLERLAGNAPVPAREGSVLAREKLRAIYGNLLPRLSPRQQAVLHALQECPSVKAVARSLDMRPVDVRRVARSIATAAWELVHDTPPSND